MATYEPREGKGLLESLTTLAATLVGIAHTRLDLLSTDLEEEREHMFSLVVLALVALFCLGIGVVLATILLVVAFWDTHRLLVLGTLTGFFLVMSFAMWAFALHKVRSKPRLFAASLSELEKDRQELIPRP
ncbi:MAG TPA: phage holin family protein [Gammaproteobacteria bacterium]|nr:phage holin family protein [Gammaproteobacteria bacterium]